VKVRGRVKSDAGAGIPNLRIELWYFNLALGLRMAGETVTTSDGTFVVEPSFTVDPLLGGVLVNLHVRAKSEMDRLLWRGPFRTTTLIGSDWDIPEQVIPQTTLTGWRVTNLDPAGNHQFLSRDNFVEPLVDNELAWSQTLKRAVEGAATELNFLLFLFEIENLLIAFDPGHPVEGQRTTGTALEDLILKANLKSTPVTVRIVPRRAFINSLLLKPFEFGVMASAGKRVKKFFENNPTPNTVQVRLYECNVLYPMHAKLLTIDGNEAQLMGSPLDQQYYDAQTHNFDEPRRGRGGNIKAPIHDVGVRVRGPAVAHLRDTFGLHWQDAEGPALPPVTPAPPDAKNATVQVVRSLPGSRFPTLPDGETGILEAYLRVFENAKKFIYLENQYFVEKIIIRAIRKVLGEKNDLQVICLINSKVDMKPYNTFQRGRLPIPKFEAKVMSELIETLKKDKTLARFGLFALWGHDNVTSPKHRIVRNYVHSKVAIADDLWATVGSANLDGVSLYISNHRSLGGSKNPEAEHSRRATEVNVLLFNAVDGLPDSPVPKTLRKKLWAEHLGLSEDQLETPPDGGWLKKWKDLADDKVAGLIQRPPRKTDARILPWKPKTSPKKYLKELKINPDDFDVRKKIRKFDFDTGRWL
jgi:phosphatidylserine/phosphatidylglycerophosphate/cardiolipin synthase-like enzyme